MFYVFPDDRNNSVLLSSINNERDENWFANNATWNSLYITMAEESNV